MKLKVFVEDFWEGFKVESSLFDYALQNAFEVEYVNDVEKADLVLNSFFSKPGIFQRFKRKKSSLFSSTNQKRVFFSGEPFNLPVGKYHGVISFHSHFKSNHFRLPLWVLYCNFWDGVQSPSGVVESNFSVAQITTVKRVSPAKFASAIFSNKLDIRLKAVEYLKKFGEVDVFGYGFNKSVKNKQDLMEQYKYNMCFENTIIPGYITEKALQAKMAGTIPLWWGDPSYRKDFNEKALVNVYEYDFNFERIFDEVDMKEIVETPLLSQVPYHYLEGLSKYFKTIMNAPSDSYF